MESTELVEQTELAMFLINKARSNDILCDLEWENNKLTNIHIADIEADTNVCLINITWRDEDHIYSVELNMTGHENDRIYYRLGINPLYGFLVILLNR